jgi:hypothetical protein
MGVFLTFLPGLSSKCDPPYLYLPSSWDYRCELLHVALSRAGQVGPLQTVPTLPCLCSCALRQEQTTRHKGLKAAINSVIRLPLYPCPSGPSPGPNLIPAFFASRERPLDSPREDAVYSMWGEALAA